LPSSAEGGPGRRESGGDASIADLPTRSSLRGRSAGPRDPPAPPPRGGGAARVPAGAAPAGGRGPRAPAAGATPPRARPPADGLLVANAPHVPVHLGAMGETVRDLIRSVPELPDDQHWLTNDPAAGGSHLPDLTVVTPVRWDGVRLFVACRAHHVDVGGSTP